MSEVDAHSKSLHLLKKHGKSFNFARWFLDKDTGVDAARLYGFCRVIDDIVDEPEDGDIGNALAELEQIENHIQHHNTEHAIAGQFVELCQERNINPKFGLQLIKGVKMDSEAVALQTKSDLIQYAYLVAGVVGLMMSPILKAPTKANVFAVDLGIGMQLTNIARDVMEDAIHGRRYIPGDWVDNLPPELIANPSEKQRTLVNSALKRLLMLADSYYKSGIAGISYLPKSNQLGILVAANVYKDIGRVIEANGFDYTCGRCVVPMHRKITIASACLFNKLKKHSSSEPLTHEPVLHYPIKELLNIN